MPKNISSFLTRSVIEEICSRLLETSEIAVMRAIEGVFNGFFEIETDKDEQQILKAVAAKNNNWTPTAYAIIKAYPSVKKGGIKIASKPGRYICNSCLKETYRTANQPIAPCECEIEGAEWVFYFDWETQDET